jgi:hypothetical protein
MLPKHCAALPVGVGLALAASATADDKYFVVDTRVVPVVLLERYPSFEDLKKAQLQVPEGKRVAVFRDLGSFFQSDLHHEGRQGKQLDLDRIWKRGIVAHNIEAIPHRETGDFALLYLFRQRGDSFDVYSMRRVGVSNSLRSASVAGLAPGVWKALLVKQTELNETIEFAPISQFTFRSPDGNDQKTVRVTWQSQRVDENAINLLQQANELDSTIRKLTKK